MCDMGPRGLNTFFFPKQLKEVDRMMSKVGGVYKSDFLIEGDKLYVRDQVGFFFLEMKKLSCPVLAH